MLETSAGSHEADVLITACGQLSAPKVPSAPGPRNASPAPPSIPPLAPRRRPCRQARRGDRHGLQRDPGRPGDSAARRAGRRLSALSRLDSPEDGLRLLPRRAQRLFERFPALQRLDRASVFASTEVGAAALTRHRWMLPVLRAAARRQITKAIDRPRAAPQGDADRRGRLQADHAHRRLVSDRSTSRTSSSSPIGSRRSPPAAYVSKARRRAGGRRARPRHRLRDA